jgi:hypothetical protein
MTVKILSSTSSFNGVSYNTNKTQTSKGELMKFKNFGYLQHSDNVTPEEMKTFLKVHSNRNKKVKDKQFHAVISCKEREYTKIELTKIAEGWLQKMGYGANPYLIVFHSDTKNNHVHMVSSRIGTDGRKIKDNMERVRGQKAINEIMNRDVHRECQRTINDLKSYSFSTVSQAKLFLENSGYSLKEEQDTLKLYKYGIFQGQIPQLQIAEKLSAYSIDKQRQMQLKAIIDKYLKVYTSEPSPVFEPVRGNRIGKQVGYRSELSDFLKDKFGLVFIYHGKEGKDPYGYTIIDHKAKIIFKGSEIYPLKKLMVGRAEGKIQVVSFACQEDKDVYLESTGNNEAIFRFKGIQDPSTYRLKLLSSLRDFASVHQGLAHFQLEIKAFKNKLFLQDPKERLFTSLESILKNDEYDRFALLWKVPQIDVQTEPNDRQTVIGSRQDLLDFPSEDLSTTRHYPEEEMHKATNLHASLSINDDIDDEAIHGRDRRKKRATGRKNSR